MRVNCGVIAKGFHAEARLCRPARVKGTERKEIYTREIGETSDSAVVRFVVCLSGKGRGEPREERERRL